MLTDGRTDDGVIGILIAHLGAFGSGELKKEIHYSLDIRTHDPSNYTMNHPRFTVSNQKEESIFKGLIL